MKAYPFIISRTLEQDYRTLTNFSVDVCDVDFLKTLKYRAECLKECYKENAPSKPQWLFMKERNYLAYGFAGLNQWINDRYCKDRDKRPLRCFVGIIIKDYLGGSIPFGESVLSIAFQKIMDCLFFIRKQALLDFEIDLQEFTEKAHPSFFDNQLNTNLEICRISKNTNSRLLVDAALAYNGDISFFFDIQNNAAFIDKGMLPMNILTLYDIEEYSTPSGLNYPTKQEVVCNVKWNDGNVEILPPVMYGTPGIIEGGGNPIKRWIRNILLIVSLILIAVFVCFAMFKSKGERPGTSQPIPSLPKEKGNNSIENSRDRNNILFISQHELPEQNRGIHERTDGEFYNPISEGIESRNSATPTDSVYDPQGNNGDASAGQSPYQQTGAERP